MQNDSVVRLDRVCTVYEGERIPAIRDINLAVNAGDFFSIVGPNGAGKTTLLETINGLLRLTSGDGHVFGLEILRRGHYIRTRIGYLIQNFEIDPLSPFLCKDVVISGRAGRIGLLRFPSENDWSTAQNAMEIVGMSSFYYRPIGKLSGGEFQKILLARAIAQEPDLFLLDEPFANLDARARGKIDGVLSQLNESGATIMMVSHEIGSIPRACSHIIVMDEGRIVRIGERDDVLESGLLEEMLPMQGRAR